MNQKSKKMQTVKGRNGCRRKFGLEKVRNEIIE